MICMQFNKGVCSSGQGGMHYCIGCASCVVLCCTLYSVLHPRWGISSACFKIFSLFYSIYSGFCKIYQINCKNVYFWVKCLLLCLSVLGVLVLYEYVANGEAKNTVVYIYTFLSAICTKFKGHHFSVKTICSWNMPKRLNNKF